MLGKPVFFQNPLSFILTLGTAYAGAIGKSIGSTAASAKAEKRKKSEKVFKDLVFLPYIIFFASSEHCQDREILNTMVYEIAASKM